MPKRGRILRDALVLLDLLRRSQFPVSRLQIEHELGVGRRTAYRWIAALEELQLADRVRGGCAKVGHG